ncbi:MAG: response regulator [Magnetococcales bacterium]|nr:response regulator [Magnetococcales bacterium]
MARILIIEDERQVREVLKQMLERAGFEVETAFNGIDGIENFKKNPIDLVITDILMPEKDGLETIEELTKLQPGLPILAISGGGPGEKAQFALDVAEQCGARRILAKPFSRKEILAIVHELLTLSLDQA